MGRKVKTIFDLLNITDIYIDVIWSCQTIDFIPTLF